MAARVVVPAADRAVGEVNIPSAKTLPLGAVAEANTGRAPPEANEVEINVFLRGIDDTTHQPIYAHHRYESAHILYDHRHKDILSIAPDGLLTLDQRDFDRVESLQSGGTPT